MPTIRHDPSPAHHDNPGFCRDGDESRLYISYSNRLRRVLATIVNTSDANLEDACSFAWLQLLETGPRRETIWPWLVKVAEREAWRIHRQDCRAASIIDERDHVPLSADPVEVRMILAEVIEALPGIHERRREMLLLHATGFTIREIAEAHEISPARARELVYRARLELREALGRGGVDPDSRR